MRVPLTFFFRSLFFFFMFLDKNYAISFVDPTLSMDFIDENKIIVSAAVNEKKPILLRYKSKSKNKLTVEINLLTYEARDIDARWLINWFQGGSAGTGIKQKPGRVLIPELLVKNPHIIKLDHDNAKNYILTNEKYIDIENIQAVKSKKSINANYYPIKDSLNLKPFGVERGAIVHLYLLIGEALSKNKENDLYEVVFFENGVESEKIKIKVITRPFELDDSNVDHALYYRGRLNHSGNEYISSEYKTEKQLKNEFINLREHGINLITTYQNSSSSSLFKRFKGLYKSAGFDDKRVFYLGEMMRPNMNEQKIQNNKKDYNFVKKEFFDAKVFIYGIDEAKGDEIDAQTHLWQKYKREGYGIISAGRKDDVERVASIVDIFVAAYEPDRRVADIMHSNGGKIYAYANPQVGVEDPILYRKNYGYELWQKNYDGAMTYAYQHTEGLNIWNDFDSSKYRDHVFAYPIVDGVIDTLAWEGYREAVDDLRYLSTLINLIDKRKNSLKIDEYSNYLIWLADFKNKKIIDLNEARELLSEKIILLMGEQN